MDENSNINFVLELFWSNYHILLVETWWQKVVPVWNPAAELFSDELKSTE